VKSINYEALEAVTYSLLLLCASYNEVPIFPSVRDQTKHLNKTKVKRFCFYVYEQKTGGKNIL
jgi:hypothetical protein